MRQFVIRAVAILALSLPLTAHADGRVFPPDNCSNGSPFMSFIGVGNTNCVNGQDVLTNAMPHCNAGAHVIATGTGFVCSDATTRTTVDFSQCHMVSKVGLSGVPTGNVVARCAGNEIAINGSAQTNLWDTEPCTNHQLAFIQAAGIDSDGKGYHVSAYAASGSNPVCAQAVANCCPLVTE